MNSDGRIGIGKVSTGSCLISKVFGISRPALWTVGSALLNLLTLGGLYASAPSDYESPQTRFFLFPFFLLLFWLGWVALTISFDCWVISIFVSIAGAKKFPRSKTVQAVAASIIPCRSRSTDPKAVPSPVSSLPTISAK